MMDEWPCHCIIRNIGGGTEGDNNEFHFLL